MIIEIGALGNKNSEEDNKIIKKTLQSFTKRIMIQTITIDIINDKALKLLQDLELLQLIRLHKEKELPHSSTSVKSFKGSMTKQPQIDIDTQLNELRNGWE